MANISFSGYLLLITTIFLQIVGKIIDPDLGVASQVSRRRCPFSSNLQAGTEF